MRILPSLIYVIYACIPCLQLFLFTTASLEGSCRIEPLKQKNPIHALLNVREKKIFFLHVKLQFAKGYYFFY